MKNSGSIIIICILVFVIFVLVGTLKTTIKEKNSNVISNNYKNQTILILNYSGDTLLYENGDNIKDVDYYGDNVYIYYNNGCKHIYKNVITIVKE